MRLCLYYSVLPWMFHHTILAQEFYYLLSMQQTYCRHEAKEFIHAIHTVISTFRFSNLYIKNLLFARQIKYYSTSLMEAQSQLAIPVV